MSNRKKLTRKGNRPVLPSIDEAFKYPLRYNGYICERCGKGYLTLDIDNGVTPMFMPCLATQGCEGRAHSMMYPEGEPPAELGEPIIHWYKPTGEEFKKLSPAVQQHVSRGGLARKATEAAPDWVKDLI